MFPLKQAHHSDHKQVNEAFHHLSHRQGTYHKEAQYPQGCICELQYPLTQLHQLKRLNTNRALLDIQSQKLHQLHISFLANRMLR